MTSKRSGVRAAVWLALAGVALPVAGRELARLVEVREEGREAQRDLAWSVGWVQLEGDAVPAEARTAINDSLRRMTLSAKRLMLIHLKTWEKPADWTPSSDLAVGMTVGLHTPELLSVSQSISNYFAGTAHPNLQLRARTFDLQTGRRLHRHHILRPDAEPLLAERITRKLRTLPDYRDLEIEVPADEIDEVMLGRDGVTFLFSPYDVAAYAVGPVIVELTWQELDGLLVTEGPVARLAAEARARAAESRGINRALGETH
jgi:hypothetical protein